MSELPADVVVTGLGRCLPAADVAPSDPSWFDAAAALPGRGRRRLPPACQYLLVAAEQALSDAGPFGAADLPERRGLVVATNNGNLALQDELDRALLAGDMSALSPSSAPYFSVSVLASRLATEQAVRGFSLTVTSPRSAGLEVVEHGARALWAGRAGVTVLAAVECALPPDEAGAQDCDVGAVALVGRPAGTPVTGAYGRCRTRSAFLPPGVPAAEVLDRLWSRAVPDVADGPPLQLYLDDSALAGDVARWARDRVADVEVRHAPAGCLTPLRAVADLLETAGPPGAVATVSAEGNVAVTHVSPSVRPERGEPTCQRR